MKTNTEHALALCVLVGLVHAGAQSLLWFVFGCVGISVKTNIWLVADGLFLFRVLRPHNHRALTATGSSQVWLFSLLLKDLHLNPLSPNHDQRGRLDFFCYFVLIFQETRVFLLAQKSRGVTVRWRGRADVLIEQSLVTGSSPSLLPETFYIWNLSWALTSFKVCKNFVNELSSASLQLRSSINTFLIISQKHLPAEAEK